VRAGKEFEQDQKDHYAKAVIEQGLAGNFSFQRFGHVGLL
jgi:hypothetical protein